MQPMIWTPEFCTVCDKQCLVGTVYCSEACREADMLKPGDLMDSESTTSTPAAAITEPESDLSEEEDGEVPHLWLTLQPQHAQQSSVLRPASIVEKKKKEGQFLYASPMLRPTTTRSSSGNMGVQDEVETIPPLSPLMISGARQKTEKDEDNDVPVQSVKTYQRWLADGAC